MPALDLQPVADQMAAVTAKITDDQLDRPTPCTESDVTTILGHVCGLTVAFRDAARKLEGPTTTTPPADAPQPPPDDWRSALPGQLNELAAAWREDGATEGMTTAGGVQMPAEIMLVVANNELLLHAWDLAVATGQVYDPPAANLEASYAMVSETPDTPEDRHGLFGPVVVVPDDAPLLDRTLGYAGRDPRWSPTDR